MSDAADPSASEPRNDQYAEDCARLDAHCRQLGEYYDTVQIFVTRYRPDLDGKTQHCHRGTGNWFTRYGQIREWQIYEDQRTRNVVPGPDQG